MSIANDQNRLSQCEMLEYLQQSLRLTDMVTVYFQDHQLKRDLDIFCALIPASQVDVALSDSCWNLSYDQGMPDTIGYYTNETSDIEYRRYGTDNGIEPLVIYREFLGMSKNYQEVSEEFRFFHRLYHDFKRNCYIKFSDNGDESLIVTQKTNKIEIRVQEIREFLAVKEMYLSIQFDCRERSEYPLGDLGVEQSSSLHHENLMCWSHSYGCNINNQSYSRLLGIKLIEPLPKAKSRFYGFGVATEKKSVEFIIDMTNDGDEILAGRYDADSLTPVYFRKQVLDKYYNQPSKYSIGDTKLCCGNLWCIYIDNHHTDKVCVWLGDLGRDLPYEEQLHWRTYNIPPQGGISETYFQRQILAQYSNSDYPEHVFKHRYHYLNQICNEFLGWHLLSPLHPDDNHNVHAIRIPASNEQGEFDALVLSLTKILVDSINEKELKELITSEEKDALKGISLLDLALKEYGVVDADHHIGFLRKLQNLRSSSSAHRKGKNYQKIARSFGIDDYTLQTIFTQILTQAVELLDFLIQLVHSKTLSQK